MLGGLDPIIIFQLYKRIPEGETTSLAKIPLISKVISKNTYAIIPIYLSETLTGISVDGESKNIDIDTTPDSLTDGEPGPVTQKNLGSVTTVNLKARSGSVGLTILLALSELILDKVASQEYEVTYMHGAVTVFGGLIHSFSFDQGGNDDLYRIKIDFARGRPKTKSVVVDENPNAERLPSVGTVPQAGAPTVSGSTGSQSAISPNVGVMRP